MAGLLLAYMAYLERAKKEGVDLTAKKDGYTAPQRFYIGYAQNWCENSRPEQVRTQVLTDPHSPDHFRANGAIVNQPGFAAAFGCKKGVADGAGEELPRLVTGSVALGFERLRERGFGFLSRSLLIVRQWKDGRIGKADGRSGSRPVRWLVRCGGAGFSSGRSRWRRWALRIWCCTGFCLRWWCLLPLLVTHRPGLNRREWGLLLAASFLGVPLQFLIQFYALSITTVSHASLMVGTMPVILAVGAAVFAHERMDWVGWAALAGSTLRAALIALGGGAHATGRGDAGWRCAGGGVVDDCAVLDSFQ